MRLVTALIALIALMISPAAAQTLTPTCVANADGTTKTCTSEIPYDGLSQYAFTATATNPTTGDKAETTGVVLPLCQPIEVTRPSGKLQIKWVCAKELTVTYTLTKQ